MLGRDHYSNQCNYITLTSVVYIRTFTRTTFQLSTHLFENIPNFDELLKVNDQTGGNHSKYLHCVTSYEDNHDEYLTVALD